MIIFEPNRISTLSMCKYLFLASILLVMASCSNDPLEINTSKVKLNLNYTNLDSILVHTDTTDLLVKLLDLRTTMPDIIDYEIGYCLHVGRVTDEGIPTRIYEFRNDSYIKRLEERIEQKFNDLPQRHAQISEGFKHLKGHLPASKMPQSIVFLNSFFASSSFCTENDIAIGLERYLGAKMDVIQELPPQEFFEWIKEGMNADYLERDALAAWIMTHIVEEKSDPTTIEAIIQWGKILYLTEAAFPEKPKHIIARYNEVDYNWAIENERSFWKHLVDKNALFKHSEQDQMNYLKEAPFTAGLPEKGPDRLGQFLGWRIIQSYMNQHDITIQELMKLPYTELLQEYEIEE